MGRECESRSFEFDLGQLYFDSESELSYTSHLDTGTSIFARIVDITVTSTVLCRRSCSSSGSASARARSRPRPRRAALRRAVVARAVTLALCVIGAELAGRAHLAVRLHEAFPPVVSSVAVARV